MDYVKLSNKLKNCRKKNMIMFVKLSIEGTFQRLT